MAPELADWHDFFITTATVSGALVGLLFIAVSLHLPVFNDDRYEDLQLDARSILLGYVIALSLSLFPLMGHRRPRGSCRAADARLARGRTAPYADDRGAYCLVAPRCVFAPRCALKNARVRSHASSLAALSNSGFDGSSNQCFVPG